MTHIRPLVICLFRHADAILVMESYDPTDGEPWYRPLGGGIEFGEHSRDALIREIHEELGASITDLRYLFTIENIFVYDGRPGHEIVQVYDGRFVDATIYQRKILYALEGNDEQFDAMWKTLEFFRQGHAPLYPDGLLERLDGQP